MGASTEFLSHLCLHVELCFVGQINVYPKTHHLYSKLIKMQEHGERVPKLCEFVNRCIDRRKDCLDLHIEENE